MPKRTMMMASLLALALAGCGDAGTAPATDGAGTMTARINGRGWRSTSLRASGRGTTTLAIHATAMTPEGAEEIDILLSGVTGPENYRLGDAGGAAANVAVYSSAGNSWETLLPNSGTVRISGISSDRVEGTFGFSAGSADDPRTYQVTGGTFSAAFQ